MRVRKESWRATGGCYAALRRATRDAVYLPVGGRTCGGSGGYSDLKLGTPGIMAKDLVNFKTTVD
ncbi:unnamed protein product [Plutella xylostella]|uniref:(diamondback moth) hypothetical protein n=1 Tax=Plutella xylostella TaxID=51655 RepID=A0A8S4G1G3_PLUXY|nr:unnamed protein product [Plutella xylostella]